MSKKIIIGNSYLEYRDTPWDEVAFGFKTKEILGIQYDKEEDVSSLLIKFEDEFDKEGLVYFRNNSNDNILKKYLLENGYYISETAIKLSIPKFQKKEYSNKTTLNIIDNKEPTNEEITEIQSIAETSFNYSRFHEDPFIAKESSNLRYKNWINDLVNQKKQLLIFKNTENEILSFMFYSYGDGKVDLILGGSKQEYGLLTPSFFFSIILYLQKKGTKKVDVMISASNTAIFNIYINLGFNIKETMFDYHKLLRRK